MLISDFGYITQKRAKMNHLSHQDAKQSMKGSKLLLKMRTQLKKITVELTSQDLVSTI